MKIAALAISVLFLAGCGLSRPPLERQSFLLQPLRQGQVAAVPAATTLRIGRIEVAAPFDGRGLVYRRDEQRYETDSYNEFAADPADMIAAAAADWLRRSGTYRQVLEQRAVGGDAGAQHLDGIVSALYVDFRQSPASAVLAVRWRLNGGEGSGREIASEERVPLPARTPAGAAQALQQALGQALARLEAQRP